MTGLTKTVRVEVTAADIDAGEPESPIHCPVALAMARTFGWPVEVTHAKRDGHWVGVATLPALALDSDPVQFRLSRSVGNFTISFDRNEPVQPFAFRVWR